MIWHSYTDSPSQFILVKIFPSAPSRSREVSGQQHQTLFSSGFMGNQQLEETYAEMGRAGEMSFEINRQMEQSFYDLGNNANLESVLQVQ